MAESSNDIIESLIGLFQSQLIDVNTSIPGEIVSYSGGKASVKPTAKKRFLDGDVLDFPIIPNVRVCWPSFSGGSAGIKGAVMPGDKCLIVFSQQAVDGSDDMRAFDLQDAYAVMCDLGNTVGQSTDNESMIMYFGSAYIKLTPSGKLEINAPGGTYIDTPIATNTGQLVNKGLFTYQSGMAGTGGGAGTVITGTITQTGGNLSSNGVVLDSHVHSGVTTGGGNTGDPV